MTIRELKEAIDKLAPDMVVKALQVPVKGDKVALLPMLECDTVQMTDTQWVAILTFLGEEENDKD